MHVLDDRDHHVRLRRAFEAAEDGIELLGLRRFRFERGGRPIERDERIEHRAIGTLQVLEAGAVADASARCGVRGRELRGEPRFADAGIAADEHEAAARLDRGVATFVEPCELARAADQRTADVRAHDHKRVFSRARGTALRPRDATWRCGGSSFRRGATGGRRAHGSRRADAA
jgi:hypothetical protein